MNRAGRPVFLDLARISYPVGAIASIAHRVSGVVLVLALPLMALGLQRSLTDEAGFHELADLLRLPAALLAWAAAHHLFAGIRHLLMDVGIGASLQVARTSAYAALIAGLLVAAAALLL